MGEQEGTYGGGPLATITFRVEGDGTSALDLIVRDNDLIGIYYDPGASFTYLIPHAAFGSLFRSSKPAAHFEFWPQPMTPQGIAANQTILFNATKSSDPNGLEITSYYWEFGDGVTTTESDPIAFHAYKNPGVYTASLTVTNSEGESSETFAIIGIGIRDIAITEVKPSHITVMQNNLVKISVTVETRGNFKEDFLIQVYLWKQSTSILLGTYNVTLHKMWPVATRYFVWDTTGYDPGDYIIQAIVPPLIAENNLENNEIDAPITLTAYNLIDYPVKSGSQVFHVIAESNSTLPYPYPTMPSSFKFNSTAHEIGFNVTGSTSTLSYCNLTIPKALLSSQPLDAWTILLDGALITKRLIGENDLYTFIYFDYTLSEHKIQIIGTNAAASAEASAHFTYSPLHPTINDTVTFDASGSYEINGGTLSYLWDLGDDIWTVFDPITTHVYVMPGTYTVSLTVADTDGHGLEDTVYDLLIVEPWQPQPNLPVAIFHYSPALPLVNQTVTFDASYSYDPNGPIVSYSWDFGDGTNQTSANPVTTHIYAMNGTYTVSLTVTDNDGLEDTVMDLLYVESEQPEPSPPIAIFHYSPPWPLANQTVVFDASYSYDPDGFITVYLWDFGDGTVDNGTNPITTHVYAELGTYLITLTIVDNDGLIGSTLKYLTTVPPEPEVYVYPSTVMTTLNDTFTVDIRIQGVANLFAWEVSLSWDASILDFVDVAEGAFLKGIEDNPTFFVYKTYEDQVGDDSIYIACTRLGYVNGVDGNGALASVKFRTTGSGSTILDLYDTELADDRPTPYPIEHYSTDGYVISQGTPIHDVAITYVDVYPRQTTPGHIVGIEVEVQNQGTAGETFNVTAFYGDQVIGAARVWYLPRGTYQWLVFSWDTTGVAEGTYTIRLEADVIPGETDTADNTFVDGVVTLVVPKITLDPSSGPVGTKVTVIGKALPVNAGLYLTFDDQLIGLLYTNETGEVTAVFNVPLSEIGSHVVKVTVSYYMHPMTLEAPFTVTDATPLDLAVDVGAIYFKGETVEFYIQTALRGTAVDATSLTVQLHRPDGTTQTLTPNRIGTGLYTAEYKINGKSSMTGTYTLAVEAQYNTDTVSASGTSIKTFLVKPTWERELPKMAALSITAIGLIAGMLVLWKREKKRYL